MGIPFLSVSPASLLPRSAVPYSPAGSKLDEILEKGGSHGVRTTIVVFGPNSAECIECSVREWTANRLKLARATAGSVSC